MSVAYNDYRIMANKISYWILKNNIKVKLRKEYTLAKEKKSFAEVKKIILKNKDTNNSWGRKFLEAMVIDNTDTSLFPKYVTYKNKQYSKAKYIYMAKYVTAWWKNHDKAPASVPTEKSAATTTKKTTTSSILKPFLTEKGCKGMGQCTGYFCACNSLQQSFYRLTGILVPESTIAGWAGTTSSGTDHAGIATAVAKFNKTYNKKVKLTWYGFSDLTWAKITEFIKKGAVFFHLLYRNKWGHYEPIKSVGDPLKILNSLGDSCGNGTYCGYIESRSKAEQKKYISGITQKSVAVLTI